MHKNQGWQSHRTFFPKKSHRHPQKKSHRHPQKNRISKLNKNNLRLFRFFYKLSTVFELVASLTVSS